ncbi:Bacterial alpha-L-rhamnosidase [Neofusicoccum parvum]|nr:Bacterial alpha-L-rhamnosidase [Neofusicoccum parvum]
MAKPAAGLARKGIGANVEAGLLQRSDWAANFITSPEDPSKDKPHRPTLFRQTFNAKSLANARARLYITSLGVYEAHINGRRVGDLQMTPGWTSYRHRLQYQVYDVTSLLQEGENAIGVEVAEGWYAGRLRWGEGVRNFYGGRLGVLAQLEIQLDDGSRQQIISDDGWRTHQSSLVTSELYDGEVYHAHEEPGDWTSPAFSAGSRWQPARLLDFPKIDLILPDVPPVRVTETLEPREIFKSKSGKTLVDFGQNLVGKIFIRSLQKPDGHTLKIRHAEVLENGELGTRPLRNARAEDTVVFSKQPLKDWSPRFTFHGFRYVQIEGWSLDDEAPPAKGNISALVMHSDMQRTGHFHCSNDLVNKLHQNVVWSMRGNFLSIPTDCPQRDERLGWTGDIQVFSPTASYLYSSGGLLANWLQDVAAEQADAGGIVPLVVPDVLSGTTWPSVPQAVWDDAAILVPWTLYRWTGDAAVLRRQLPSMRAHLDAAVRRGPDGLWDAALWQLGDWLDPAAPPREPGLARTDGTLVADAYLVRVTDTVAQVCAAVGEHALAARYRADHARLRAVFAAKYVAPSGLLVGDTQTALALALCFSLHDGGDEQVRAAADRLARLVRYSKFRVSTGFAGTPLVLAALSGAGHVQLAYRMLLEEKCPSWLYPVTMGATTVWERWDSMLADGSINPGEMTSFNHYALGSVADWLHTTVGGLSPLEPGWKTFRVGPVPGGTVTTAEVRFESPYGTVESEWVVEGESEVPKMFKLKVNVPPNTSALIVLPGQKDEDGVWVGSGSHQKESAYEPPGQWPPKAMYTQFKEGLE